MPSDVTAPTTGGFAGKSFTFKSGASALSSHAVRVASFFYGLNTNAGLGDASLAPAVGLSPDSHIDNYLADNWLQAGFLKPGTAVPKVENNAVVNDSWIAGTSSSLTATVAQDLLRRLDFSIVRDDYVCCVGMNNGSTNTRAVFAGFGLQCDRRGPQRRRTQLGWNAG